MERHRMLRLLGADLPQKWRTPPSSDDPARRIAALLAVAVLAAACSGAGQSTSLHPSASATPVARSSPAPTNYFVPAALQGTWTATVTGTTASSGIWTLTITGTDMVFTNPVGGDPFSIGPTAVTETSLTLVADSGCPDQTTVTPGIYALKVPGSTLTVTLLSDSCGDRAATLTTSPWTRKP